MKFFRKLAKLTAWAIPSKNKRIQYKDACSRMDLSKDLATVKENYGQILSNLKKRNGKIKVIFLIRENQKWTYQSLYEVFEKSEEFEPLVLVSLLEICHIGKDKTRNNLGENYNFFKTRGMNVDYAYCEGNYIDLRTFSPDIVFYDQPWDLPEIHTPQYVSEYALTCYCPYAYELTDSREHYLTTFHGFLYKFFVNSEFHLQSYESYLKGNGRNCVIAGYPKLDEYFSDSKESSAWKDNSKYKIIYAPHHSFEKNGLRFATFRENGEFILNFAKQHPETEWIFKPHPRFKYALLRNKIMTNAEIEDYYKEWDKIGSVYDEGNYINIFKTSDLLITDCVSFLAEYLPSKNPIIWLVNSNASKFNEMGRYINRTCYSVENEDEFENIFKALVIDKKDDKKPQRETLIPKILDTESSARRIYKDLLSGIGSVDE